MSKNLMIALVISVTIHLVVMTSVVIVTPDDMRFAKQYTRVDFLGPILQKTAFDIMLDGSITTETGRYYYDMSLPENQFLNITMPKKETGVPGVNAVKDPDLDPCFFDVLSGNKAVPDLALKLDDLFSPFGRNPLMRTAGDKRQIVYKPDPPFVGLGLYGMKEMLSVQVRILVNAEGRVMSAVPLTTTGYPQLDMMAVKYVKTFIFEASHDGSAAEEWLVVDVQMKAR